MIFLSDIEKLYTLFVETSVARSKLFIDGKLLSLFLRYVVDSNSFLGKWIRLSKIDDFIGQPSKTQDTLKNINTIISKKKVLVENEILDILNLEHGKIQWEDLDSGMILHFSQMYLHQ